MTDQELKDLVASLAVDRKETERMMRETDRRFELRAQEADRRFKKLEEKLESRLAIVLR